MRGGGGNTSLTFTRGDKRNCHNLNLAIARSVSVRGKKGVVCVRACMRERERGREGVVDDFSLALE